MTLAALVRPRFGAVAALLGLGLLLSPEVHRRDCAHRQLQMMAPPTIAPLGKTIEPGPIADARAWPHGMVMAPPATGDRMPTGVAPHPVVALLSGLFDLLGSRGA